MGSNESEEAQLEARLAVRYALPGPVLLCAVALLVATFAGEDLRTSKGGRFAMFSDFENRKTHVHLLTRDGRCLSEQIRFEPGLAAQMERVANAPSTVALNELLAKLRTPSAFEWSSGAHRLGTGAPAAEVERVLIEVWALDYQVADTAAGPAQVHARKIASADEPWVPK